MGHQWSSARFAVLVAIASASGMAGGCNARSLESGEVVGHSRQALTETQARVLGFESLGDWSTSSGTLSASSTASQGSASLGLSVSGWSELNSVPLSTLDTVADSVAVDVLLPTEAPWGEVRVVLVAPSLGLYWSELGSQPLAGVSPGQFQTFSFPLNSALQTSLAETYSDLTIKVVINAPSLGSPVLIDNLVMSADGGPGPEPEPDPGGGGTGSPPIVGDPVDDDFVILIPQGVPLSQTFMSATDHLSLFSQANAGIVGGSPAIANFGTGQFYMQAEAEARANVFSFGPVMLDVKTVVYGFLQTEAPVTEQGVWFDSDGVEHRTDDAPDVLGGLEDAPVPYQVRSWSVAWPSTVGPDLVHYAVNEPTDVSVSPGAYGDFDIYDRNVVHFSTGTYYFDTFNMEQEAELRLDAAAGPVVVYVRDNLPGSGLRVLAQVYTDAGEEAQLLLGFLGTGDVFLQGPFQGTVVAPNAAIRLERPNDPIPGPHKGSFFGRSIEVAAGDHTVEHVPFVEGLPPVTCQLGDTDGDEVDDCSDICYRDPLKITPGVCGCGKPDVDDDGDHVESCIDDKPTDPTITVDGQCAQPGKSAGDACSDAKCPGVFECDGQGHCVADESQCLPDPDCFLVDRGFYTYAFCPGTIPVTQDEAEEKCDALSGQALVKIDDPQENAWVAARAAELGVNVWIGGTDLSNEGSWHWSNPDLSDGPQFWEGGSGGVAVDNRYSNWGSGRPSGVGDCAMLSAATGKWSDEDCGLPLGYICERPGGPLRGDPIGETGDIADDTDDDIDDCVPYEDTGLPPQTAEGIAAFQAAVAACQACGEAGGEPCADVCTGPLEPPVSGTCEELPEAADPGRCLLETVTVGTCTREEPTCPNSGDVCGRVVECSVITRVVDPDPALAPRYVTTPCASDADCDTGLMHYCGDKGTCIDPLLDKACQTRSMEDPLRCVGQCFTALRCGVPTESCFQEPVGACEDVVVCSEGETITDGLLDTPGLDWEEEEFNPIEQFGDPDSAQPEYPDDPPCSPNPDGTFDCANSENHPWCHFEVEDSIQPRAADDAKKSQRGEDTDVVSFRFDPNIQLNYDANPMAFGETDFALNARASFTADVGFNLLATAGRLSVINAIAAIRADRCFFGTTDSKLEIFGRDFLPELAPDVLFDSSGIVDPDECRAKIESFEVAVDRAKKALRDAQELIRQYRELRAGGGTLKQTLCEQLLAEPPQGFPPGACPEPPERTIDRFIQYYRDQVEAAVQFQAGELANSVVTSEVLQGNNRLSLPGVGNRENVTIITLPFFIGPIPCLLEVESFADYGIEGFLQLDAAPGSLITDGGGPLATVTASAEPHASAGVGLFVGAGFDAGVASASAGVSGEITLADLRLPIFASAGISVLPRDDQRGLPPDLAEISNGQNLFPRGPVRPREYGFSLQYGYGVSAELSKILAGAIFARVRVKFFFFSKTWKTKIVDLGNGYSAPRIDLLNGGGELPTANDLFNWGVVRMPTQFVDLENLWPPDPVPPVPDGEPVPDPADFDTGGVAEMFYDSLCQCLEPDEACFRNADCCDEAPICFSEPALGGDKICSTCRAPGDTCNAPGDCCAPDSRCSLDAEIPDGLKHCGECKSVDEACFVDDDCCDGGACVDGSCQACIPQGDGCADRPVGCCPTEEGGTKPLICAHYVGEPEPVFDRCLCQELEQPCNNKGECCSTHPRLTCGPTVPGGAAVCYIRPDVAR